MFLTHLKSIFGLQIPDRKKLVLAEREADKVMIAEEALERQRILSLHERFEASEEAGLEKYVEYLSNEETIKLDTARRNEVIITKPFRSLTILKVTPATNGTPGKAFLRFGGVASPMYRVRRGGVAGRFQQILLTNTAQPGASISYIISQNPDTRFNMIDDEKVVVSTTPHIYKVEIEVGMTEYSQVLPEGLNF